MWLEARVCKAADQARFSLNVGINVNAEGKLCGDVDYAAVELDRGRDHSGSGWCWGDVTSFLYW